MRKLVVVMLTVGSLLLLEAPAWAPHLYSLSEQGTETSGGNLRFDGETDCKKSVQVVFVDDRLGLGPAGSLDPGTNRRKIPITTNDIGSNVRPDIRLAYCGGKRMDLLNTLAFTGVSVLYKLAFAAALLVTGVVLLMLGRRRAGAGPS